MLRIPTCMIGGGSDETDIPLIITEIETLLVKEIIEKIIIKEGYFLVYFHPVHDSIDFRISRFIYNIQHPTRYIIIHYKNKDMKNYTYIKKAPYKLLL